MNCKKMCLPALGNIRGISNTQLFTFPLPRACWVTNADSWFASMGSVWHYSDAIMTTKASQITSLTIVYSTVYSGADQRKHQSSASLVFVREIHRSPVNSPHKWPVTRKMFPFDDVIMDAVYLEYPWGRNHMETLSAQLVPCKENAGSDEFASQRVSDAACWCIFCYQYARAWGQAVHLSVTSDALTLTWLHSYARRM